MEGRAYARSLEELDEVMRLLPRQNCVQCDSTSELECPPCGDEICQFTVPTDDCSECPRAVCVPDPSAVEEGASDGDNDGGPNVGAIAGGVVGGIVLIAILTYLAWRFLIRPRRAEEAARQSAYVGSIRHQDSEKDGASRMTRRSSTHTVHSIASTVLTRASNIIQIAYIPGVTNRANDTSSSAFVPPVPPIPMHHSDQNSIRGSTQDEQHFFVPGDLRDSTYSGLSGYSDRASYATRTSYAPRSSIASTIYGKQAQIMTPASTGMRAKPTMVSVKSSVSGGSGGSTPPVPSVDYDRFNGSSRPKSDASAFSVGSTFLNTATQARAQVVKVGSGPKRVDVAGKSGKTTSETSSQASTDRTPSAVTPPMVMVNDSPFNDPPESTGGLSTPGLKSVSTPSLGAVPEVEGGEGDSIQDSATSPPLERGSSPFGDEHATK